MTDVLLLDYNGVVVNDEPLHFEAFRTVLGGHGLALDERTYYADYLGFDDRSAFVEAWRRGNRTITGELLRILIADKAEAYAKLTAHGIPLVEGAPAFVQEAARRWPVAVVSGALRREIDAGLEQTGLKGVISAVISSEDTRTTKPDPEGYRKALAALKARGIAPTRAVAVEDSVPGFQAARAVGAGCLMLSTSHPAGELQVADAVWPSFAGKKPDDLAPFMRTLTA